MASTPAALPVGKAATTVSAPATPVTEAPGETPSTSTASELGTGIKNNDGTVTPPNTAAGWTTHYDTLKSKLPSSLAAVVPASSTVQTHLTQLGSTVSASATNLSTHATSLSKDVSVKAAAIGDKAGELSKDTRERMRERRKMTEEQFLKCAWSVTNQTQVAVNISLNQVGPLMYAVLLPNETFERRVPNVWYSLEVRPWTSPSTAYTPWSVTWPILALTGPVAAATSLLAIPFVALAAGGSALASLTAFGSTVTAAGSSVAGTVTSTTATVASLAAKTARIPGGAKAKGKLVDAAKANLAGKSGEITDTVVRYLGKGTAAAALGGLAGGAGAQDAMDDSGAIGDKDERRRRLLSIKSKKTAGDGKGKGKVLEVEVTGLDLEKVLICATGKKTVDKKLTEGFKGLSLRLSKPFKTVNNPVLRIVDGPELEERDDGKQYLVFYPFVVEPVPDVIIEPLTPTEAPPTASETTLMKDAKVVSTLDHAQKVSQVAPVHGEGQEWRDEKGKQLEEQVDEIDHLGSTPGGWKSEGEHIDTTASPVPTGTPVAPVKKGWFGWGS